MVQVVQYACGALCCEVALPWLVAAHLRQYRALRAAAMEYVLSQYERFRGDPQFEQMLKEHPALMWELIDKARHEGGHGASSGAGTGL